MGGLSWWHWVIIIAAFVLIFGAKKLPDAARGVGRSLRILKSEVAAMHEDGAQSAAPAETDASAATATPAAQILPTAPAQPVVPAPQVQQPVAAPVQPAPAAAPVPPATAEAPQVPVINGVPVTDQQQQ